MRSFLFLFLTLVTWKAHSQNLMNAPNCDLELHSVGKGESTPLQQEVEWILKIKGYHITHPTKFDLASMPPYKMFASYRAGNESLTGNADCLIEEFKMIGARFSCSYELSLVAVDIMGTPVLLHAIQHSIRLAADSSEFYRQIREQLRVFPSCGFKKNF